MWGLGGVGCIEFMVVKSIGFGAILTRFKSCFHLLLTLDILFKLSVPQFLHL